MTVLQQKRGWFMIAALAIGIALVLLLALHAQSADHAQLAAILPLLFVGVVSPLSLLAPLACVYLGHTTDAPTHPVSFQRPPPFRLA